MKRTRVSAGSIAKAEVTEWEESECAWHEVLIVIQVALGMKLGKVFVFQGYRYRCSLLLVGCLAVCYYWRVARLPT
ncbi:hypothetical protein L211DRAFT_839321 [Terfezia boudieri ATCC MYA-4762]|uniref:Uncharacterized protein n=1 Tax=Terfezia boudieri ATCC MYA-4762 TaxID=1051890 RepID=A0A3N4LIN7_9PEZI|nr:hypothetical protein L211DRAFT_839321 [Terfezia boudieri ATCC MYA-4762]